MRCLEEPLAEIKKNTVLGSARTNVGSKSSSPYLSDSLLALPQLVRIDSEAVFGIMQLALRAQ